MSWYLIIRSQYRQMDFYTRYAQRIRPYDTSNELILGQRSLHDVTWHEWPRDVFKARSTAEEPTWRWFTLCLFCPVVIRESDTESEVEGTRTVAWWCDFAEDLKTRTTSIDTLLHVFSSYWSLGARKSCGPTSAHEAPIGVNTKENSH